MNNNISLCLLGFLSVLRRLNIKGDSLLANLEFYFILFIFYHWCSTKQGIVLSVSHNAQMETNSKQDKRFKCQYSDIVIQISSQIRISQSITQFIDLYIQAMLTPTTGYLLKLCPCLKCPMLSLTC